MIQVGVVKEADTKLDHYLLELKSLLFAKLLLSILILVIILIIWLILRKFFKEKSRYIFILFFAFLGLSLFRTLPIVIDINQKSIKTVDNVKYLREDSNGVADRSGFYNDAVTIYFPGEKGKVFRIGVDSESYPFGEYTGTVVYAEHSQLIVDFIFDKMKTSTT